MAWLLGGGGGGFGGVGLAEALVFGAREDEASFEGGDLANEGVVLFLFGGVGSTGWRPRSLLPSVGERSA